MTTIAFDFIDPNALVPKVSIEIFAASGGTGVPTFKAVILGQKLAAGTFATDTPIRVFNVDEVKAGAGLGSMLLAMYQKFNKKNPSIETYVIALDDDGASVAATSSFPITGPATADGVLDVLIAGRRYRVGVTSGDTATVIGDALVAELVADTESLVAGINTTGTVALTAKNKGEAGNSYSVFVNYFGGNLPAGVGVTANPFASGAANPDLSTAIANIGDTWYNWFVDPYNDSANDIALAAHLDTQWQPPLQQGGRAFKAFRGTTGQAAAYFATINSIHFSVMDTALAPEPTFIWAADNAGQATRKLAINPQLPLTNSPLAVLPPLPADVRTEVERNVILVDGGATYKVLADRSVVIERQTTSNRLNDGGFNDRNYLDIQTPETLERVRLRERVAITPKLESSLAAELPRDSEGLRIETPETVASTLIAEYLAMIDLGWVTDLAGYKTDLVTGIDDGDPTASVALTKPRLVPPFRKHNQRTEFFLGAQ